MSLALSWNALALELNKLDHTIGGEQTGPTRSSLALGLIHLAMHDARFANPTTSGYAPYQTGLAPAPAGANIDIAISAAAATIMKHLYKKHDALIDGTFMNIHMGVSANNPGFVYGAGIATSLIDKRANDGSNVTGNYTIPAKKEAHRTDPVNPAQKTYHGVTWGGVSVLATTHCYSLLPYPAITSAAYAAAYGQVLAAGGDLTQNSTTRTADETVAGVYWAYDGVNDIGTPPRLYNQIARKILDNLGLTSEDDVMRALTLINVAMADAGVFAWREKYIHKLWRPALGIREADASEGPLAAPGGTVTKGDINWRPYGAPRTNGTGLGAVRNATPDFPAYPSGHATFGAASFQMLRLFLQSKPRAASSAGARRTRSPSISFPTSWMVRPSTSAVTAGRGSIAGSPGCGMRSTKMASAGCTSAFTGISTPTRLAMTRVATTR
jgi:Vanadium chloroperoxidase N-terminal domain